MDLRDRGPDGGMCQGASNATRIDPWAAPFIDPFVAAHEPPPDMANGSDAGTRGHAKGGCALSGGAPPRPWAIALLVGTLAVRRRHRTRRSASSLA
jgi:hypothetical protein